MRGAGGIPLMTVRQRLSQNLLPLPPLPPHRHPLRRAQKAPLALGLPTQLLLALPTFGALDIGPDIWAQGLRPVWAGSGSSHPH